LNDSLLFIEDNLFIVSRNDGAILNVLKSSGGGLGEFNQIEDFQVKDDRIIIKDAVLGKYISFDFQGNFISEKRVLNEATNFFFGDGFVIHYFNSRPSNDNYNFLTEPDTGDKLFYDPVNPVFRGESSYNLDNGFQWDSKKNEIILAHPYYYKVHLLDENGLDKKPISFDFGKYNLEDNQRMNYSNGVFRDNPENFDFVYVKGINSFFPLNELYFTKVFNGSKSRNLIFMDT
jgi:hypothetical protein